MISSRRTTIVVSCLAAAGGIAIGLGAASTADAAVRVTDHGVYPRDHHGQATRASGGDLNSNRHLREVTTINPISINDVGDNTNISRDVKVRGKTEAATPATAAGAAQPAAAGG
jgi:hypothetical protein